MELEGLETRPTTDRVKEGLFSALQFSIEGRDVLDLFAGSGQLGIECLSRGAGRAVFVDQRREALNAVRENLRRTELKGTVVSGDALTYLEHTADRFDLIFLDPPYDSGLLEAALERIVRFDILRLGGIISAEHPAGRVINAPSLRLRRTYRYGKIAVTLLEHTETTDCEDQSL